MDVLARVAQALGEARGDLMGAALADGGKLLTESDPEVSEAIDFVRYYETSARVLAGLSFNQVISFFLIGLGLFLLLRREKAPAG